MDQNFDNRFITTFYSGFYKVDEDLNISSTQKYKISSIDGNYTYNDYEITALDDGFYELKDGINEKYENVKELIPIILRNKIESVHTKNDVMNLKKDLPHISSYGSYQFNDENTITFYLPLILKQENIPIGYSRNDLVMIAPTVLRFEYDSSNNISHFRISPRLSVTSTIIELSKFKMPESINDYTNIGFLINNESFNNRNEACLHEMNSGKIITNHLECNSSMYVLDASWSYSLVPYFIDHEGTVKLEISNTVNDLTKYNASSNKSLEYKIYVKNTGNAPSGNNVITTNVPDKVKVDEFSISDNGVYIKKDNIIMWNIERIDDEQQVIVSYKALVSNTVNGEELIGNSMVLSDQQTTKVYSNNTIVTLDKIIEIINNPNTGTSMIYIPNTNIGIPINFLFVILIVICITGMMIISKIKKKKYIIK